jgi:hypothetical protein
MAASEYSYLWDGSAPEWALLNANAGTKDAPSYTIVNTATKRALLISDESIDAEVVQKMLDNGCRLLSPSDWARI